MQTALEIADGVRSIVEEYATECSDVRLSVWFDHVGQSVVIRVTTPDEKYGWEDGISVEQIWYNRAEKRALVRMCLGRAVRVIRVGMLRREKPELTETEISCAVTAPRLLPA